MSNSKSALDCVYPRETVDKIKAIVSANAPVEGLLLRSDGTPYQTYVPGGGTRDVMLADHATLEGVEGQITDFLLIKNGDHDGTMLVYTLDVATSKLEAHWLWFTQTGAKVAELRDRMWSVEALTTPSKLVPRRSEASLIGAVLQNYDHIPQRRARNVEDLMRTHMT